MTPFYNRHTKQSSQERLKWTCQVEQGISRYRESVSMVINGHALYLYRLSSLSFWSVSGLRELVLHRLTVQETLVERVPPIPLSNTDVKQLEGPTSDKVNKHRYKCLQLMIVIGVSLSYSECQVTLKLLEEV